MAFRFVVGYDGNTGTQEAILEMLRVYGQEAEVLELEDKKFIKVYKSGWLKGMTHAVTFADNAGMSTAVFIRQWINDKKLPVALDYYIRASNRRAGIQIEERMRSRSRSPCKRETWLAEYYK